MVRRVLDRSRGIIMGSYRKIDEEESDRCWWKGLEVCKCALRRR
jgi:hypothetical protein